MKNISIDFSQIPSNNITPGLYSAVINSVEVRESKSSQQPYLNFELEITGSTDEDEAVQAENSSAIGRKVWTMVSLSPKALWRVKQMFEMFGLDVSALATLEATEGEPSMLLNPNFVGAPVEIEVNLEEYNGQERARVKTFISYLGDGIEFTAPGDEDDEDELLDEEAELV